MIPYSPKAVAANTKTKSKIRNVIVILYTGSENVAIAVTAIIITKNGFTIPAFTAASPITRPPTIPIVYPIGFGNRIPASRINSIVKAIINVSIYAGNGTPSLAPAIE